MREQTKQAVTSIMLMLIALSGLSGGGCAFSTPVAEPLPSPPVHVAPSAAPSAGIMPVGTPIAIMTVTPSRAPSPTATSSGPRVGYATPFTTQSAAPTSPASTAAPASPRPQAASPGPGSPSSSPLVSMEDMTLPIYPFASKKTSMTQEIPGAHRLILVLISRDSMAAVKTFYHDKISPTSVVDSGSGAERKIVLTRQAKGATDPKLLDTVVVQPQDDGSVQITLEAWKSI